MSGNRPVRIRSPQQKDVHWSMRGLPELEHFDSDEARAAAVGELERQARHPQRRWFWINFAIASAVMLPVHLAVGLLLEKLGLPSRLRDGILGGLTCAGMIVLFGLLERRRGPRALRERLLVAGVPICRACGYALRGLPLDAGRCPECGREFDEDVVRILKKRVDVPIRPAQNQ